MQGTTMFAFRSALLDALRARPGLAGVQLAYDKPVSELQSEAMWWDMEAESDDELPLMEAGTKTVEETYTVAMVLQVLVDDGRDQQAADLRAAELLAELQQELAAKPQTIEDINWAQLSGWAYIGKAIAGDGGSCRGARFGVVITVKARLYPLEP